MKTADFMTYCHFVSSWKSIYRKRWSVFDGAIRIVRRLLQNYARNSTRGSLKHFFLELLPTPPFSVKTADFNAKSFCFLIKKNVMREETKSFGAFSYKVPFFLLVSAFFDK